MKNTAPLLITPTEGLRVVDPASRKPLTAAGLVVPAQDEHTTYWSRREAEGSVLITQLPQDGRATKAQARAGAEANSTDQPADTTTRSTK